MRIVWDERKRSANLAKHGMDFAELTESYFASALVIPAKEGRWKAIGIVDGVVTVIFSRLGSEGVSLISMRPASKIERALYDKAV